MHLGGDVDGTGQVGLSEVDGEFDRFVSVHHAPPEISVPERVNRCIGWLATSLSRQLENLLHLGGGQVGVGLDHHGQNTRDGWRCVGCTGAASGVAVVLCGATGEVDATSGGNAALSLNDVGAGCRDFGLQFVEWIAVAVVPALATGGVGSHRVVAAVDGVLVVGRTDGDGEA